MSLNEAVNVDEGLVEVVLKQQEQMFRILQTDYVLELSIGADMAA